MNDQINAFLGHLDKELGATSKGEYLDLYLLGRASLIVGYQFQLSTQDIDIVWMQNSELEQKALDVLGKGTKLARSLGLYLDPVPQGLPPLPGWFRGRCRPFPGEWKVLKVWILEVHDLAATKLKSFRPKDREDIQNLCDRGLLKAEDLLDSLKAAFPFRSPKEEDSEHDPDTPDWGKALANFKRVETS